jgi:hypothetical protein
MMAIRCLCVTADLQRPAVKTSVPDPAGSVINWGPPRSGSLFRIQIRILSKIILHLLDNIFIKRPCPRSSGSDRICYLPSTEQKASAKTESTWRRKNALNRRKKTPVNGRNVVVHTLISNLREERNLLNR